MAYKLSNSDASLPLTEMLYIARGRKTYNTYIISFVTNKFDPKKEFGNRLRQLRKDKGLSQEGLAHEAGLDRSYVGAVERGECNISLINICILADTLGIPPHELLLFAKSKSLYKAKVDKQATKV